jgi:hypothetical protein
MARPVRHGKVGRAENCLLEADAGTSVRLLPLRVSRPAREARQNAGVNPGGHSRLFRLLPDPCASSTPGTRPGQHRRDPNSRPHKVAVTRVLRAQARSVLSSKDSAAAPQLQIDHNPKA